MRFACFFPVWLAAPGFLGLSTGCSSGSGAVECLEPFADAGSCASAPSGDCNCPCAPLSAAQNREFCTGIAVATDCALITPAYRNHVCGVALKAPPAELSRSKSVTTNSGTGPPSVSCMSPGGYPPPAGTPQPVTVNGIVEIFSHGCESKDVTIEFHRVNGGNLGEIAGTPIVTPSSCVTDGVPSQVDTCATRHECRYSYSDVPTETELVIKTSGMLWTPLYEYNVYIPNGAVVNGIWEHNVRVVAQSDYVDIAASALGTQASPLRGMIMGEVHDCEDVRLIHAVVDISNNISTNKQAMTYFTSDENHPRVDGSARGTGALGRYLAADTHPGPVTVAAAGLVGQQVVALGFFPAWVYENSITWVTFRGLRPFQLP